MKKTTIVYTFRGLIERASKRGYVWRDGYSESIGGRVAYPWSTRRECIRDAASRGARAKFVRPEVKA